MMLFHAVLRGGSVAAGGSAPSAPSGLSATAVSSSQINLAWTDNSGNETGFIVETSANGTTGWSTVTTTAANATSYSHTGLTASTAYYYRVKATNAYGDSSYTSVANDTTDASSGTALFTEPFTYSDGTSGGAMNHTENGIVWGGSVSSSVVSNKLEILYTGTRTWAEQYIQFPAMKELWYAYDLTIPSTWVEPGGNWKGFATIWSDELNVGPSPSYSSANDLLMGLEFWPNGSGGVNCAIRNYIAGELDYNVHGSGPALAALTYKGLNIINTGQAGTTIRVVVHIKAASFAATAYTGGDYYTDRGAADGIVEVWVNGVIQLRDLACPAPAPGGDYAGWAGFRHAYLLGWANNGFPSDQSFLIDNFVLSANNIDGVS